MAKSLVIYNTDGSIVTVVSGSALNEQPTVWAEIPEEKPLLALTRKARCLY